MLLCKEDSLVKGIQNSIAMFLGLPKYMLLKIRLFFFLTDANLPVVKDHTLSSQGDDHMKIVLQTLRL